MDCWLAGFAWPLVVANPKSQPLDPIASLGRQMTKKKEIPLDKLRNIVKRRFLGYLEDKNWLNQIICCL
jgi:hypothetical protein